MSTIAIPSDLIKEPRPSTRTSMALRNKVVPVDTTLATAGTAENIFLITVDKPTINLVTNPSMETADPPTGYTLSGSTLARDVTYYLYGSYGLSINPDNAAAGEGGYWTLPSMPKGRPLTVSVYFRDAAASGDNARIRIYGVTTADWLATGNTVTLSASWQRSTAIIRELPLTEVIRIYLVTVTQHNTTFYADGLQAEMYPFVTDYCDGAQSRFTFWGEYPGIAGTANASESWRKKTIWEPRGFNFFFTRDTYIDFDRDADSTSILKKAGTDWWMNNISFVSRISILNVLAGEQPRVTGDVWGVAESGVE